MGRAFLILYQMVSTYSIASSLQNESSAMNIRESFRGGMCEKLCKSIGECSSATNNQDFLKCLVLKVTGMSDMTIFQLSTQNCYPSTTDSRTGENRTRGYRCQQKGTVKRRKNPNCKQHNYKSVRAGRETIHVKYHSEPQTWDGASEICHSEGATLAMPDTKAKEIKAMMALFPFSLEMKCVLIGLRDLGKNDTFSWVDGSPLSYQHWRKGEPTYKYGDKDEDCVVVLLHFGFSGNQYAWNDVECSQTFPFICQCY